MEEDVTRLVTLAAAAHPGIAEPPGLRDQLAARLAAGAKELETRAADLYLAAACVAGDPHAIATFDASLPAIVRPALAKLGLAARDDDEIVQRVRVALIAPAENGERGLVGYTGRGALRAYVRSAAVRIALKRLQRETQPPIDDQSDLLGALPDTADTPESGLAKAQLRTDLRAAFATAVAGLTRRERTLLRQHYVDGLTVDLLAPLHQAHRSTCARWIEAARDKILRAMRKELQKTHGLAASELERAIAMVTSRLDLSLSRHLASSD